MRPLTLVACKRVHHGRDGRQRQRSQTDNDDDDGDEWMSYLFIYLSQLSLDSIRLVGRLLECSEEERTCAIISRVLFIGRA